MSRAEKLQSKPTKGEMKKRTRRVCLVGEVNGMEREEKHANSQKNTTGELKRTCKSIEGRLGKMGY